MLKPLFSVITTLLLIVMTPWVAAQNEDTGAAAITYDQVVTETIASDAIFDWWFLDALADDVLVVDMRGANGLAPLIGLLDPGGTLIARSEDGQVNGLTTMEFTLPEDGQYVIVATRVGNENGTSTGDYELRVRNAVGNYVRENPYQQVTFRCTDMQATNAATLEFADDFGTAEVYRINVYGMDGFVPVIRVYLDGVDVTDCSSNSQAMGGDSYSLPGGETVVVEGDLLTTSAQLTITGANRAGNVSLTIGSRDGAPGRYMALIEGFAIDTPDDVDTISVGQGPLAAGAPLLVYMVAGKTERLDPSMELLTDNADEGETADNVCDDAGRRGCEDVPSLVGLRLTVGADVDIMGDRFDAGALLPPGNPQLRQFELSSFDGNTSGTYSLVLMGELPALD